MKKEIDIAVPKILKIKSSKLLKRENRLSANSRISGNNDNSPRKDAQKDIYFQKNGSLYRDVPIQTHKESNRANVTNEEHSYFLRLSANVENSADENSFSLNDDKEEISVKNVNHEILKNICEKKLDLVVVSVCEILRLCDECHLVSERIANERNNRYYNSTLFDSAELCSSADSLTPFFSFFHNSFFSFLFVYRNYGLKVERLLRAANNTLLPSSSFPTSSTTFSSSSSSSSPYKHPLQSSKNISGSMFQIAQSVFEVFNSQNDAMKSVAFNRSEGSKRYTARYA